MCTSNQSLLLHHLTWYHRLTAREPGFKSIFGKVEHAVGAVAKDAAPYAPLLGLLTRDEQGDLVVRDIDEVD
jgi:hypothetical protein